MATRSLSLVVGSSLDTEEVPLPHKDELRLRLEPELPQRPAAVPPPASLYMPRDIGMYRSGEQWMVIAYGD